MGSGLKKVILPSTVSLLGQQILSGCNSLTEFDFSVTKINKLTQWTCYNCINLKEVVLECDVAKNIINVYNTKGMFYNCRSLNNIDLTDIGTTDVNDMSYMFYNCQSLNNIDLTI